jgi:hypothetical protein
LMIGGLLMMLVYEMDMGNVFIVISYNGA